MTIARSRPDWTVKPPVASRLLTAELRVPDILEYSPFGMALLGLDGHFLVVNPALCRMLGCDEQTFGQMTVTALSHPDDANRLLAELVRLRSGQIEAVRAERYLQRPDGRAIWAQINVSLVLNACGDPVNFFVHVGDISDRVLAQEEAEFRVIQQTALTEFTAWALRGCDPDQLIDHAVQVVASCLPVKAATIFEVAARHDLVLAACVTRARRDGSTPCMSGIESHARSALSASAPVLVTHVERDDDRFVPPLLHRSGVVANFSAPVRATGQAHAVLSVHDPERGYFTDDDINFVLAVANTMAVVIERRSYEEATERLNRQERLTTMGQLAAGVAHDFNNIVSTIGLYADLVDSHQGLDASSRRHLGIIRDQTERAKSLVWQVLDFAQGRPLVRTEIDLSPFLASFLPVLRSQIPSCISIELHHDSEPYRAHVDPGRLQQIVMNLVTNARDAMSGTGSLVITLSRGPNAGSSGSVDAGVEIQISDTGSGFVSDTLERALEPFFTTKAPDEGTGLGLAQVQSLVAQHGGHLSIDSVVGEGTTVTVWLPEHEQGNETPTCPVATSLRTPHRSETTR